LARPSNYTPLIDYLCVADIINSDDKFWIITYIFDPISANNFF